MKRSEDEDMNPTLKPVEIGDTARAIFDGILDKPMKSLKEQLEFIKENKFGHVWEDDDDRHRKVMRDVNNFLHAVTDSFSSKHAEAAKHIEGSTCDSFRQYLHEKLNESLLSQHLFQDSWDETQQLIVIKISQIKDKLEGQHDEQPKQKPDLEIMISDTKLFDPIHIYHALLCCQVVRDCEDPEYSKDSLANLKKEHLLTELSVSYENENVPKYVMARCGNVLYVCFQGVQSQTFGGTEKSYRGEICAGISNAAKKIPLKYFGREIILNNRIVFSGHSSGGAVASLVCTFLLEKFKSQKEEFLKSRIKCITFGLTPFANSSFKSFVEAIPGARDCFSHIVQKDDIVPKLFGSFKMKHLQTSAMVAEVLECLTENEMLMDAVFHTVGFNHLDIFGTYYILDTSNEGQTVSVKSSEEATVILQINDDEGLCELHSKYLTNNELERYIHEVEIAFTDGKLPDMKKFEITSSVKMVQDITPKVTEVTFENFGKEVTAKIAGKNMWFVHNVSIEGLNNADGENADRKDLKVNLKESSESEVQTSMGTANIRIKDKVHVNVKTHFNDSKYLEHFDVPAKESTYPVTRRQQQLAKLSPQEVIELAFLSAVLEHRSETQQSKRFEAIKAFFESAVSVVPVERIFHAMVHGEREVVLQCCELVCSSDALQTLPNLAKDSLAGVLIKMKWLTSGMAISFFSDLLPGDKEHYSENEKTMLEERYQLLKNTTEVFKKILEKRNSSDTRSSFETDLQVIYPSADDKDKRKRKEKCCKTPMALLTEGREKLNRLSKELIAVQSDAKRQKMSINTNNKMLSVLTNLRKEFKTCGTLLGAFMESQVKIPLENVGYGKYFKQLAEQAGSIGLSVWGLLILPFQYLYQGINNEPRSNQRVAVELSASETASGSPKYLSPKRKCPDYDEKLEFLVASMKKSVTCNDGYISYSLERQLEDQCMKRHLSHRTSVEQILEQWNSKFKAETLMLVPDDYRRLVARWIKWSLMINHLRESLASQTAIGIIGFANSGKSTFVKSLLEHETITGTTVPLIYNMDHIIEGVDVIDFPGVDDRDKSIPDVAKLLLNLTRIIVFVVDYRRAYTESTKQWLSILEKENVPVLICLTFADKLFAELMGEDGDCDNEKIKTGIEEHLNAINKQIGQSESGHQREIKLAVFSLDNDSKLNTDEGKKKLRKAGLSDELDVGRWIAEKLQDYKQHEVSQNVIKFIDNKEKSTLKPYRKNITSDLVTERKGDDIKDEKERNWFKDTFLDSKRKLKKEIHEKLRSFPWLCGAYGLTGPTKKIRRPHLYLTVKRGVQQLVVLSELEDNFKCNPSDFFELFEEPERKPNVKYMMNPSSHTSSVPLFPGGGVSACSDPRFDIDNPLRVRDEIDEDNLPQNMNGTGTLTMFCTKNGHHYALTCCHVGFANDENSLNASFNRPEKIKATRRSFSNYKNYLARNQQYYFLDHNKKYVHLGDFDNCYFDDECDILSLKVSNTTQIACKVKDTVCPDWDEISDELYERVFEKSDEDQVNVEKVGFSSGLTEGYIAPFDLSYKDEDILFQDAFVVKSPDITSPFLEDGDSGALVFFYDKNDTKQVFAYGVCEVDTLPLKVIQGKWTQRQERNLEMQRTLTGPYYICLRLDVALERLGLLETTCLNNCGSQRADSNTIKQNIGQPDSGHQGDLKMTVASFDNDSNLNSDVNMEKLRQVGLKDEVDVGRWIAEKLQVDDQNDDSLNIITFIEGKKESTLNSNRDPTGQPAAKKKSLNEEKRLNEATSSREEQPTCSKNYRPP